MDEMKMTDLLVGPIYELQERIGERSVNGPRQTNDMSKELFDKFIVFCEPFLISSKDLIKLIKKKYDSAEDSYKTSTEFQRLVHSTKKKIVDDNARVFVYIKDFVTELKAYTKSNSGEKKKKPQKRKRGTSTESTDSQSSKQDSVQEDVSNEPKKAKLEDSKFKLEDKRIQLVESKLRLEGKPDIVLNGQNSEVKCHGSPCHPEVSSTCSPTVSPQTKKASSTVTITACDTGEVFETIELISDDEAEELPPREENSWNELKPCDTSSKAAVSCAASASIPDSVVDAKIMNNTPCPDTGAGIHKDSEDIFTLEEGEIPRSCRKKIPNGHSPSVVAAKDVLSNADSNDNQDSLSSTEKFTNIPVNTDPRRIQLEASHFKPDMVESDPSGFSSSPPKHQASPFLGERQRRVNDKNICRLERLLAKIRNEIEKVKEMELSLEEMADTESSYMYEDKLQRKFVKVWDKLCELKGRRKTTGRPMEQRFNFEGTRYPEINRRIEKFVNKEKIFPDYHDIKKIVAKVNQRKTLNMTSKMVEAVARDAFTDVGNRLQERRLEDFFSTFGCTLTDKMDMAEDPALKDPELKAKLEENQCRAKSQLDSVLRDFSEKQCRIGEDPDKDGNQSDQQKPSTSSTSPSKHELADRERDQIREEDRIREEKDKLRMEKDELEKAKDEFRMEKDKFRKQEEEKDKFRKDDKFWEDKVREDEDGIEVEDRVTEENNFWEEDKFSEEDEIGEEDERGDEDEEDDKFREEEDEIGEADDEEDWEEEVEEDIVFPELAEALRDQPGDSEDDVALISHDDTEDDEDLIDLSTDEAEDDAQSDDDHELLPKTFTSVIENMQQQNSSHVVDVDNSSNDSSLLALNGDDDEEDFMELGEEIVVAVDEAEDAKKDVEDDHATSPVTTEAIYVDIADEESDSDIDDEMSPTTLASSDSGDSDIEEATPPKKELDRAKLAIHTPQKRLLRKALGFKSPGKYSPGKKPFPKIIKTPTKKVRLPETQSDSSVTVTCIDICGSPEPEPETSSPQIDVTRTNKLSLKKSSRLAGIVDRLSDGVKTSLLNTKTEDSWNCVECIEPDSVGHADSSVYEIELAETGSSSSSSLEAFEPIKSEPNYDSSDQVVSSTNGLQQTSAIDPDTDIIILD